MFSTTFQGENMFLICQLPLKEKDFGEDSEHQPSGRVERTGSDILCSPSPSCRPWAGAPPQVICLARARLLNWI